MSTSKLKKIVWIIQICYAIVYFVNLLIASLGHLKGDERIAAAVFSLILAGAPVVFSFYAFRDTRTLNQIHGYLWLEMAFSMVLFLVTFITPSFRNLILTSPLGPVIYPLMIVVNGLLPLLLWVKLGLRDFIDRLSIRGVAVALGKTALTLIIMSIGTAATVFLIKNGIFSNFGIIVGGMPIADVVYGGLPAIFCACLCYILWTGKK